MLFRASVLCCVCLVISSTTAFVRRDVSAAATPGPNILESFQKNMDDFRKCIDQSLAKTVSEVNEKQLQPVLQAVGDHLNRASKAYDDLTAPAPPKFTAR